MAKLYRVTDSPCSDDETPFAYNEDGFVGWVDEVFLEGYKQSEGTSFPSVGECLDILEGAGYVVEVIEEDT